MDLNKLARDIDELKAYMHKLRKDEKTLIMREKALASEFQIPAGNPQKLKNKMVHGLPSHLVPGNVGNLYDVTWPFWYTVNFDFGTDPTISTSLRDTKSFSVSQEAAFILLGISRSSDEATSTAGAYGPWQINFQDRQSSRKLNDLPIPFQMLGSKANITPLPTGYLIMPNAFIDVEMSGSNTIPFVTSGEAKHQIMFHGVRIRVEAADKILSTIYGE